MKHVFWLERIKRDGVEQVRPRRATIEKAIMLAKREKEFITDEAALGWFMAQRKGRLVK